MANDQRPILRFLVFLLCAIQVVWIVKGPVPFGQKGLVDPDSFMRLNRVHHLAETGEWFATRYPRSNAPYGEDQHWTRPFDVLLLIGAGVASVFVPFATGLHYWGVLISPLLQFFTLMGVLWMARPLFDRDHQLLIGGLFLLQPGVITYFFAGRPDHHSLLLLCFVLLLGLTIRMIAVPEKRSVCVGAGAVAGLAVWVSVEAFLAVVVGLSTLTLGWIRYGHGWTRRIALMTRWWWIVASIALVLEHGFDELLMPEYDRYSFVHWILIATIALFWQAMDVMARREITMRTASRRLGVGLVGLLVVVGIQWILFPKFFEGPLVDVDPRVMTLVWERVSETQPLVSTNPWQFGRLIFHLGIALPAIPFLAWLTWKEQDFTRRWFWIMLTLGSVIYLSLAFSELRWVPYAGILMIFPYAHIIGQALRRLAEPLGSSWQYAVKIGVVLVGCTWPLLAGAKLMATENSAVGGTTAEDCPLIPLSAYLSEPQGFGRDEHTILAFIDFGPELLYRTPHRVVVTPYHRNAAGILDAHAILSSEDRATSYRLLRDRHVDLILLCSTSPTEPAFYRGLDRALYNHLEKGRHPAWLSEVTLPPHLSPYFRLFRVKEPSD